MEVVVNKHKESSDLFGQFSESERSLWLEATFVITQVDGPPSGLPLRKKEKKHSSQAEGARPLGLPGPKADGHVWLVVFVS